MIEHRRYIRLSAPIGITYQPLKKSRRSAKVQSLVRNLSGGGVSFLAKEILRCGDLLKLQIQIPHLAVPVEAVGEVIWYQSIHERDRELREAGTRFRDIESTDLHHILEYVHTIGIGSV